jgi:hypothetical protein
MNLPPAATQSVTVYLKAEDNGEVLDIAVDPPGVWQRAEPSVPEESLSVLATVDPYANTVFDFRSCCSELEREIGTCAETPLARMPISSTRSRGWRSVS